MSEINQEIIKKSGEYPVDTSRWFGQAYLAVDVLVSSVDTQEAALASRRAAGSVGVTQAIAQQQPIYEPLTSQGQFGLAA